MDPRTSVAANEEGEAKRELVPVPLRLLRPSRIKQPRSMSFDVDEAFLDSLREFGVLEAIWVRTRMLEPPDPELGDRVYELIFGERRSLGAQRLGWSTIIAEVHDELSDLDVFKIQLAENERRKNLSAFEQADAVAQLMAPKEDGGFALTDTAEIAAILGVSLDTVYHRIALAQASRQVRDAFYANRIYLGSAIALSSLHDQEQQDIALAEVMPADGEEPYPVRRVQRLVQDRYHLRLASAPFDLNAEGLVAGVPVCKACPKRAGAPAQQSLFTVGEAATPPTEDERCTDRACFVTKRAAWRDRLVTQAQEKGLRIISGAEGVAMYPAGRFLPSKATGLVDLDEKPSGGNGKTYRELCGDKVPVEAVAVDGDDRVHELADRAKVRTALLGSNAVSVPEPSGPPAPLSPEPERKNRAEAKPSVPTPEKADDGFVLQRKAEEAAGVELLAEVAARAERRTATVKFWRFVLRGICLLAGARLEHVIDRRELRTPETKGTPDVEIVIGILDSLDEEQLRGLLAEIVASQDGLHPAGSDSHALAVAARFYSLDLDETVKGHAKRLKAEARKNAKKGGAEDPPPKKPEKPTKEAAPVHKTGTCSSCGCTNENACSAKSGDVCVWANVEETLCSECAKAQALAAEVIEDGFREPTLDELVKAVVLRLDEGELSEDRVRRAIEDATARKKLVQNDRGRYRVRLHVVEKKSTEGATPSTEISAREQVVVFLRAQPEKNAPRKKLLDELKKKSVPPSEVLRAIASLTNDGLVKGTDPKSPVELIAPTFEEVMEKLDGLKLAELRARHLDIFQGPAPAMGALELKKRIASRLSGESGPKTAPPPAPKRS